MMNAISQTLDSRLATGLVVLEYSAFIGHIFLHDYKKQKSIFCKIPAFIACIGTAIVFNEAAFHSGKAAYQFTAAVVGSAIVASSMIYSYKYYRIYKTNKILNYMYDISVQVGGIGFLIVSAAVQLKLIEKLVVKLAPAAEINLAIKFILGGALWYANYQTMVYLQDCAEGKEEKIDQQNKKITSSPCKK